MMKKILVADDDMLIRTLIKTALNDDKYDDVYATNVEEAINMFDQDNYDIVISDIVMPPGPDGTHLMRHVRSKNADTLIIAMTSGVENAIEDYLNLADMFSDHTLAKPFSKEDLLNTIEALQD